MRVTNDGCETELASSSASTFYSHLLAQQEAEMKLLGDQLLLRWPVPANEKSPSNDPKQPNWALQEVVSYLGYTGRDDDAARNGSA